MTVQRETARIQAPGGELAAYRVRPARGPVLATALFVHGKTFASIPDFDLQVPGAERTHSFMEYLATRGIDTWTFDHRGFGLSWKPPVGAPLTATTRAEDLLAVLPYVRERAQGPFTVAGLSLGCAAAAYALRKSPGACDAVVLMGPSRWRTLTGLRARLSWMWDSLTTGTKRSSYWLISASTIERRLWVGEEHILDRAAFEQFSHGAMTADPDAPAGKVKALVSDVFPYDFWDPVINVPTLAIRGANDELATEADIVAVRKFVPPHLLTVRTFAGRKHDLHIYRERDDVFACLHDFIRAPQASPARAPRRQPADNTSAIDLDTMSEASRTTA